jgi:hypothetical protein
LHALGISCLPLCGERNLCCTLVSGQRFLCAFACEYTQPLPEIVGEGVLEALLERCSVLCPLCHSACMRRHALSKEGLGKSQ